MSVRPPLRYQMTWWMSQSSNAVVQPGTAQHLYIARSARRWARLAVRELRPRYSDTPSAATMIGVISAQHAQRRSVSTGRSIGTPQSMTDSGCSPCSYVAASMSTDMSICPDPRDPPPVARATNARARR